MTNNELYTLILDLTNQVNLLRTSLTAKVSASDVAATLSNIETMVSDVNNQLDLLTDKINGLTRRIERLEADTPQRSVIMTYTNPVGETSITSVSAGNKYTTTYTNPDYPRRLSFTNWANFDSGDSFTITGKDFLGTTITDTITYGDSHSTRVFMEISEIDLSNLTNGTVDINWSTDISLGIYNVSQVYSVRVDGTIEDYDEINTTYGWIRFTTIPNGIHDYLVYLIY